MKSLISKYIVLLVLLTSISNCFAGSFYDQRYRGWLWFEEGKKESNLKEEENIGPDQAREEVELFAKELEERKFVMLARPTVKNVKAYRDKEQEMWQKAIKLDEATRMANFLYPQLYDHMLEPTNAMAVKLKREIEGGAQEELIKEFATKFDLVLFFRAGCKYCKAFEPVLANFAQKYGFNIEAASMDGEKSEFFKTSNANEVANRLGIEATPTVIAVSHDSKVAFELIRGFVSMSELEEYSALAVKYLQREGKW
jgi:conjugal transfer pilus assembly protein TraF